MSDKKSLAIAYSIKRKSKFASAAPEALAEDVPENFDDVVWDDEPVELPESREERLARIMSGFRTKGLHDDK